MNEFTDGVINDEIKSNALNYGDKLVGNVKQEIKLDIEFKEYSGLFVNIKIFNVNFNDIDYPIYISGCYYRKRWNLAIKSSWEQEPIKRINVSKINLPGRFFEGTFPELDILI